MKEQELIDLFLRRDPSAPAEAQRIYGQYCRQLAFGVLGNSADAEECVNVALFKAWESIPRAVPEHFGPYLARITRNAALDMLNDEGRDRFVSAELDSVMNELSTLVSGESTPEEAVIEHELRDLINSFVEGLPEEKREIFVARYFRYEDLSGVSASTGKSVPAVKTALHRMRKELKDYLNERGYYV